MEANLLCHYCQKPFESKTGIILHRLDGAKGYSRENCALMHNECHIRYHAENPTGGRPGRSSVISDYGTNQTDLVKVSKRYDNASFLYWWDIPPNKLEFLDRYDNIKFAKKDSSEFCIVPTAALKGFLVDDRKTSRGEGNWGIKVLKNQENKLAFEPGRKSDKWLFLPVVWIQDKQDD